MNFEDREAYENWFRAEYGQEPMPRTSPAHDFCYAAWKARGTMLEAELRTLDNVEATHRITLRGVQAETMRLQTKCDKLEAENKRLREALEARRDWFAMQLKDTGNGNLSEWDRHTLQIELDATNAALTTTKGS